MILYRTDAGKLAGINPACITRWVANESGVIVWTGTERVQINMSEGDWLDAIRETTTTSCCGIDELEGRC